ncbi:MAG: tRNA (guanosine(37)-N1)-methyltransferase TrmD, partial [Verrucomicrobia bacterium]|nr:tRNA (guanosine(37)-N1)-methyltransferase TrmD [Verrucomicrobiota bacterium]
MKIHILSLFPEYFQGPFDVSIIKRARDKGILDIQLVDIRDFAEGKHKKVDDRPYGGG